MKFLLCYSILATLATTFSLAAETTKLHPTGNSTQSPPESGVNKTSTPGQHYYSCSSYQKCSLYLGPNSACNSQGKCVCEVGYEQALTGSELCQKATCSKVADCQRKFGAFSHCNRGSCVCDADFSYDLSLKRCSRSRPPTRRQSCSSRDCQESLGLFSSCNPEGRCVCDMGYEEQERGSFPNGSSSCQLRYCRSATDCMTKYGRSSHCNNDQGICSCDTGYAYDLQLERCTLISPTTQTTLTISSHYSCSSFSDCTRHLGVFSSCNAHGRCVCDMGFEERATTGSFSGTTGSSKCEQRSCNSTPDCMTKYGIYSHCNNLKSCSCDTGYFYDYTTQLCSSYSGNTLYHYDYYSSSLNLGLIIGLPVAIIGLIIISVAIIIIVRRRRQQEMAATVAARAAAMQRSQHPQNPPQNPQQNPQHPVHFQQQNLPPYTGYQPQPAPPQYQPPAPAPGFIYPSVSSGGSSSSSGEQQYLNSTQRHFKS